MIAFEEFPKISRLSREVIVTEKIDGTNAQILIVHKDELPPSNFETRPERLRTSFVDPYVIFAGSRNRYITPEDDNFGFAKWVREHAHELVQLGPGRHFGEWWGQGIQRGYGMPQKVFSLFNVTRWENGGPECVRIVPVLYRGPFNTEIIEGHLLGLRAIGSHAAPGFMKPEGIVVFHKAANICFKKTIEKDDLPKGIMS